MNLKEKILWRIRMYSSLEYYKSLLSYYYECKNINRLNILESNDTLDFLKNNEFSFIRWGCGESNHFFGGQNPTQNYDMNLSSELSKILKEYTHDSNYLLGIPSIYIKKDKSSFRQQDKSIIRMFNSSRYLFDRYSNPELIYGDAFVFRAERNIGYKEISELWDGKDTILLSGNPAYGDFIKNETNPNSFHFLKTPIKNSYEKLDILLKKTKELTNTFNNKKISGC